MNAGKRTLYAAWGLCLALGMSGCAHHHGHHGPEHGGARAGGVIIVTGSGEAYGAPNLARTSIGIEVRAATVQEAMQQANAQVAKLTSVLKEQGIAESDLRTNNFSVSYDREYTPPRPMVAAPEAARELSAKPASARVAKPPAAAEAAPVAESAPAEAPRGAYLVNNQLEVTIRDVGKLGSVLSAATASGANNIWGIGFDIEDKRPLTEKARELAFQNAKADAERIAALSGAKLGRLLRVNDGGESGNIPYHESKRVMAADSAVPVQAGQLTVTHQVELEYALDHDDKDKR